jgi:hypothetical protein
MIGADLGALAATDLVPAAPPASEAGHREVRAALLDCVLGQDHRRAEQD